jgi:hypothetical protein
MTNEEVIKTMEKSHDDLKSIIESNHLLVLAEVGAIQDVMKIEFRTIKEKQDKTNGKINQHAEKISELEKNDIRHVVDCPAMPKIEQLEKEIIGSWLRKHWKTAILIFIGILWLSYSLFALISIEDILNIISKLK